MPQSFLLQGKTYEFSHLVPQQGMEQLPTIKINSNINLKRYKCKCVCLMQIFKVHQWESLQV